MYPKLVIDALNRCACALRLAMSTAQNTGDTEALMDYKSILDEILFSISLLEKRQKKVENILDK